MPARRRSALLPLPHASKDVLDFRWSGRRFDERGEGVFEVDHAGSSSGVSMECRWARRVAQAARNRAGCDPERRRDLAFGEARDVAERAQLAFALRQRADDFPERDVDLGAGSPPMRARAPQRAAGRPAATDCA